MRVTFAIHDPVKRIVVWEADMGKRRRVPGTMMGYGRDVPHDIVQYVVEAATGYENGFWGLLAKGATYRSAQRRRTKPGRAVIAQHRDELRASEHLAGVHVAQWRAGMNTPVTRALDCARERWDAMSVGDELVFEWPSPCGRVTDRSYSSAR